MMKRIKLSNLQKEVICTLLLAAVLFLAGTYHANHLENEYPGMIRLHIIANSDSPEDQMIKLKVRNELLQFMEGTTDLDEARTYIDEHLTEIEAISAEVTRGCGAGYGAEAKRKVTFIPEKSYEDLTLPAGNYEALQVTLGAGEGQNWWCVIFPQLCLIGEEAGQEKLVLKSKIKEMLQEQQEKGAEPA